MGEPDKLRLFVVRVETEVVVAAESLEAAQKYADRHLVADLNAHGEDFDCVAEPMSHVPAGYDSDTLPYGVSRDVALSGFDDYRRLCRRVHGIADQARAALAKARGEHAEEAR